MKKYVMYKEIDNQSEEVSYKFIGIHNAEEQDFVNCLITLSILANDKYANHQFIFTEAYFTEEEVDACIKFDITEPSIHRNFEILECIDLEEVCNIFLHISSIDDKEEREHLLKKNFYFNGIDKFEKSLDN
jgi:hypothetical protein